MIKGKMRRLYQRSRCLECSPYNSRSSNKKGSISDRWKESNVVPIVKDSRSYSQALRKLGVNEYAGGNQKQLKKYINKYDLSTKHFDHLPSKKMRNANRTKIPLDEILVEKSTYHSGRLKKRLIRKGLLTEKCYECEITEWNGKPLTIQLDHINGVNNDHRLENLRMLCPNCHSQTPTFVGRHNKKPANTCEDCGTEINHGSERCKPCYYKTIRNRPEDRKFDPTPEELKRLVWEMPATKVGEKFDVSSNAIKKRCKKYDIETPGRGYWQKKKAGKK